MFVAENMSEELAMLGRSRVRGDSSQSYQQTIIDSSPQMSIDDLLKEINGANGMPVLFVPSSDGRLVAVPVPVNGLQNLALANRDHDESGKKKQQDFRAWLLLLASLIATVTFTAGLTPPGGFWGEDKDGHIGGNPIMRDKFPRRYRIYVGSNRMAFCFSMVIIGILANNIANKLSKLVRFFFFPLLVPCCLLSLTTSFISGTWDYSKDDTYSCVTFVAAFLSLAILWGSGLIEPIIERHERSTESSA